MKILVGTYRYEYVEVIISRETIIYDMDHRYVGDNYYDWYNHLWYDNGIYIYTYIYIYIYIYV